ncbi:MAG: hypothetical protein B5M53_05715 [Candidatus Cloacimonas sp. 4484_209]|nr:MAG: hypothetical protein B5M53_05715 [Candidatus Cloacimonas sp. 4484_209]
MLKQYFFHHIPIAILIAFIVLSLEIGLYSQAPDTLWTKTYGGTSNDWGYSVQECASGGFVIAGMTYSFGAGGEDAYLIRTDAAGDTLWTKTYGGTGNDGGWFVQECASGGFIIAAETQSFGAGWYDIYLIRTDENGNTLWTKTYGGSNWDQGYSVQECASGGFIIVGRTASFGAGNYDVYLIRTDESGNILWTKTYGGTGEERGWSVQECTSGGFVITGYTNSFGAGGYDVYLIRTDENGNILWTKTYGGTNDDAGRSVQECASGGFIIGGRTRSFGAGGHDVWLIRTDENGDTLWTKTYGGTNHEWGRSVWECSSSGFIIAGWTASFGAGNYDVYIIRTDENGNTLWTKTIGGTDYEESWSVQECTGGGFIIAGHTASFGAGGEDVYLIRLDADVGVEEPCFTAIAKANYIKLQWRLEVEHDCLEYIVLKKSKNDTGYSEISRIAANSSSPCSKTYFLKDEDVQPENRYFYKLGVVRKDGNTRWYGPISTVTTRIKPSVNILPNPFTRSTKIRFQIQKASKQNSKSRNNKSDISVMIYDITGKKVREFTFCLSCLILPAEVVWDGRDDNGKLLPTGIYYCRLVQTNYTQIKKIVFLQ